MNIANKYIIDIEKLFPNQIKTYRLSSINNSCPGETSLLQKHFTDPPTKETFEILILEIAMFLQGKQQDAVYSFFQRATNTPSLISEWTFSCARLNTGIDGEEVVIFSYNLQFLGSNKKRLYRILENEGFFKENFGKVSTLTSREKEIVKLLASGMSTAQIAAAEHISIHTVNTHRKSINDKLHVQNIAGLLKFVEVFDLIDEK